MLHYPTLVFFGRLECDWLCSYPGAGPSGDSLGKYNTTMFRCLHPVEGRAEMMFVCLHEKLGK